MSETSAKPIPGTVLIEGVPHLPGPKGVKIPLTNFKAQDVLQHEMVYQLTDYALDLSAEIARFNGHSRADLAQFDALLAQEYGVTRDPEFRGNRTYTSADGKRQVKIALNDRVIYGPELQAAKQLLDEVIRENAGGAGPVLTPLVNLAFRVDKEGKVDPDLLRAIRRLEVPDPRWPNICRAIDDAERVIDTTSYIRFYRAGQTGKQELIPLDIASAHPTPEAFSRQSLRRQVEELQARIAQMTVANHPADLDAIDRDPAAVLAHAKDLVRQAQRLVAGIINRHPDYDHLDGLEEVADAADVLHDDIQYLLDAK